MLWLAEQFLSSIDAAGLLNWWNVVRKPLKRPFVSLGCALFTVANCFFAICTLAKLAPDA
jgi:hypothetical protein